MHLKLNFAKVRIAKASPAILIGVGIVSTIAGVVAACNQTTKIDKVLDKHDEMMDDIRPEPESEVNPVETEEVADKPMRVKTAAVYAKTAGNFVKLYAAPAGLILLGMGSFLVSHRILNKRYLGAVAAYTGVSNAFEKYRKRVIEDQGIEKDSEYRFGKGETAEIEMTTIDEDTGDEIIKKKQATIIDADGNPIELSEWCILFASWTSKEWSSNEYYNRSFIAGQEDIFDLMTHDDKVGMVTFKQICQAFRLNDNCVPTDDDTKNLIVGYPYGSTVKFEVHERWVPDDKGGHEPIYYIEPIGMRVLV